MIGIENAQRAEKMQVGAGLLVSVDVSQVSHTRAVVQLSPGSIIGSTIPPRQIPTERSSEEAFEAKRQGLLLKLPMAVQSNARTPENRDEKNAILGRSPKKGRRENVININVLAQHANILLLLVAGSSSFQVFLTAFLARPPGRIERHERYVAGGQRWLICD